MRVVGLDGVLVHLVAQLLLAPNDAGKISHDNQEIGVNSISNRLELYLKVLDLALMDLTLLLTRYLLGLTSFQLVILGHHRLLVLIPVLILCDLLVRALNLRDHLII